MSHCRVDTTQEYMGIPATIFDSDELRVVVIHGKGTDISEIWCKRLKINLLFRNPWGPKNPLDYPNVSPHDQTFRDYTGGGWSDIIPNAGDPCEVLGANFGLHDETPLLRWSAKVQTSTNRSATAFFDVTLAKYPFRVTKKIRLDSRGALTIEESIENNSREELPFSWLIHPTFNWEFAKDAVLRVKAKTIRRMDAPGKTWDFPDFEDTDGENRDVTRIPGGDAVLDSTLVLGDLGGGQYSITNERLGVSFELTWDKSLFPNLWYYRSINAPHYPYFGRSKFIALEPCTSRNTGLAAQVRNHDAPTIGAGGVISTTYVARISSPTRTV